MNSVRRIRSAGRWTWFTVVAFCLLVSVERLGAQLVDPDVITIGIGKSELVATRNPVQRVSIGNPEIADAIVVSPREVLVNAQALGTTSLIIWDAAGNIQRYTIAVTVDAQALQRQLNTLFPGEDVQVTASGNTVVLSGTVRSAVMARRVLEIARATGATVIENLTAPPPQQVMLQVRFAEVSRTAAQEINATLNTLNADELSGSLGVAVETASEGLLNLLLFGRGAELEAIIRALKSRGEFRSLAEPNLLALDGQEASFLAGGEFPFPVVQGGGQSDAVTIQFREFGVQLEFLPVITSSGTIRLRVAPEVSSLDFANALTISGFTIPSLLTRRAETEVELRSGQTLAIAGLMDQSTLRNATKIPFLGDLPVLGALFRSTLARQNRTELLVLVTPEIVQPTDAPRPLPTGEPETWKWDRSLRRPTGPNR